MIHAPPPAVTPTAQAATVVPPAAEEAQHAVRIDVTSANVGSDAEDIYSRASHFLNELGCPSNPDSLVSHLLQAKKLLGEEAATLSEGAFLLNYRSCFKNTTPFSAYNVPPTVSVEEVHEAMMNLTAEERHLLLQLPRPDSMWTTANNLQSAAAVARLPAASRSASVANSDVASEGAPATAVGPTTHAPDGEGPVSTGSFHEAPRGSSIAAAGGLVSVCVGPCETAPTSSTAAQVEVEYYGECFWENCDESSCHTRASQGPSTPPQGKLNPTTCSSFTFPPSQRPLRSADEDPNDDEAALFERVRDILLANRMASTVESAVAGQMLEMLRASNRGRREAVEGCIAVQGALLQKAVGIIQDVELMERRELSRFATNHFRAQPWQRDDTAKVCTKCEATFGYLVLKHHCRRCGRIFCHKCSSFAGILPNAPVAHLSRWQRLCSICYESCVEYQRTTLERLQFSNSPQHATEISLAAPTLEAILTAIREGCKSSDGLLPDSLPPFYVVKPDDWYTLSASVSSGWLNVARRSPYSVLESVQQGASEASVMLNSLLTSVLERTKKSIREVSAGLAEHPR